ncbi:Inner-membrane translocator [Mesotoga infera]|uniref:Inner-membrane translocator n=1 Tax=Mesotoga infera TaxID=1236046 RepID=A0A7Z7LCY4_9BACT|nr:ABC transporter permease [Mesotoga infera]SSC11737.1 Inner-membrane translocator [Mesotoga infera]
MRVSRVFVIARTLSTLVIALSVGFIVIVMTVEEPLEAIFAFFLSVFTNTFYFGNLLSASVPLIFTGLAAAVAFSSSSFNLGLEGQVYLGALVGTYIGVRMGGTSPLLILPVVILSGFFSGALIAGISGLLKGFRGVNELISSLLLSNGIVLVVDYIIEGPFNDGPSGLAASMSLGKEVMLPRILEPSSLHSGLFLALIMAVLLWAFMFRTRPGYDFRVTGKSPRFAYYGGINVKAVYFWSMFLSGGLAAVGGIVDVLGVHGRVLRGFSGGYGWNGIAVALIARNHPLGVVPAALFFAYLESGAQIASFEAGLTPEISRIVQAVVFYLVTAEAVLSFMKGGGKVD